MGPHYICRIITISERKPTRNLLTNKLRKSVVKVRLPYRVIRLHIRKSALGGLDDPSISAKLGSRKSTQ